MSNISDNNKRIAKNTLLLYMRMLFLMVINFYTSRVVLDKLGIENFGIYNVVGGVAVMFVFFRSSLSNATQRFLNVELGRGNIDNAQKVFAQHFTLYAFIATLVLIVGETIGLWFVYNKLVIPADRLTAALWVYHFTLISLGVTLIGIVYNSEIIAHEDMKIYSYISIFEGVAKLVIAYVISISYFDKLIVYGFLLMLLSLAVQCFYVIYCSRRYTECHARFMWNKKLLKETSSIVGWNTVGTAVYAINESGLNILLNLFFGPAVNAARAVSYQISNAINGFASNFFVAVRPQIFKSYAVGDNDYLLKLFYNSSKFSFFLLWLFCLPLCFSINPILNIWLTQVPEYADIFTIWVLAYSIVNMQNEPIWAIALAVGKIKRFTLIGNSVFILAFPLSYIALKLGCSPVSVFAIMFFMRAFYIIVVLNIIKKYVDFSFLLYFKKVIRPIFFVSIASLAAVSTVYIIMPQTLPLTFVFICLSVLITCSCIWFIGLSKNERIYCVSELKNRIKHDKS